MYATSVNFKQLGLEDSVESAGYDRYLEQRNTTYSDWKLRRIFPIG